MERESEKISIVIPAYNCEKTIGRCLTSALEQTYPDKEIIVVDDGSSDQTPKILDEFQSRHAEIRVIHKQNEGVAAARNDGMRAASGIWLVTLDADDYIDADMLSTMHASAERAQADLVICGFRMVYETEEHRESRQVSENFEGSRSELINTMFVELYDKQLLNNQNNKLYRLSMIKEHELYYDPAMQINEDLWFSLSCLRFCSEISVLRRAFLNYTQHEEGESLVSRYHENCVDTCFSVLKAYDALFDACNVADEVVNAMNNRMLFLICGYAGWQYYKTDLPDEKRLQNIRALCERPEFQRLLEQTDPVGIKNRTAHYLLKRKKAEIYHSLCKWLYRSNWKENEKAVEKLVEKLTEKVTERVSEKTTEKVTEPAAEKSMEQVSENTEEKETTPSVEANPEQIPEKELEPAAAEETESGETPADVCVQQVLMPAENGALELTVEAPETADEAEEAEAAEEADEPVQMNEPAQADELEEPETAEPEETEPEAEEVKKAEPEAEEVNEGNEPEEMPRHHKRRRAARRPHDPEIIEGQIEMWDILRANGTIDGITDEELESITKKLEEGL